jgi:carbamate kinase
LITVVALGGNALSRAGERGTAAEQLGNLREAVAALEPLLAKGNLVVTHGNGPQVGRMLLRHERAAEEAPPHPLYLVVAETQAEIGSLLAAELQAVTERAVACILTHVAVAPDDPAFDEPTKPIGPFYPEAQARELERSRGWRLVSDAGRGWRRVVPSPLPLEVVELDAVRTLVAAGTLTIACGGGGIPCVRRGARLHGIDAVIDKDFASSVLARGLGAERLVIVTDVPALYRDFDEPSQEEIRQLSADDAEALAPELPPGSMRPKLEAAVAFVRATGGETLVCSAESLAGALTGSAGTRIA